MLGLGNLGGYNLESMPGFHHCRGVTTPPRCECFDDVTNPNEDGPPTRGTNLLIRSINGLSLISSFVEIVPLNFMSSFTRFGHWDAAAVPMSVSNESLIWECPRGTGKGRMLAKDTFRVDSFAGGACTLPERQMRSGCTVALTRC